jgi:hypothetical protein
MGRHLSLACGMSYEFLILLRCEGYQQLGNTASGFLLIMEDAIDFRRIVPMTRRLDIPLTKVANPPAPSSPTNADFNEPRYRGLEFDSCDMSIYPERSRKADRAAPLRR